MMQAAETWAGDDAMSVSQAMSGQDRLARWFVRNTKAQRGVWPFTVVMGNPVVLRKNLRGERFQLIVMIQAAETCAGNDAMSVS
jgi:hypothetical protein